MSEMAAGPGVRLRWRERSRLIDWASRAVWVQVNAIGWRRDSRIGYLSAYLRLRVPVLGAFVSTCVSVGMSHLPSDEDA